MYYEYYINRNNKEYNLDDFYKKILTSFIYICLDRKYKINIQKKY